jgi:hypothetical protein
MSTTVNDDRRLIEVPNLPPIGGPVNTFLSDFQDAVETYAETHLTVEIVDVDPPGGAINGFENVTFGVRVSNGGPLHVIGLTVLIEGLNGTTVGLHGGALQPSITSGVFDRIDAHAADTFTASPDDHYHFQVGGAGGGEKDLVKVSVAEHGLELSHLLTGGNHTDPKPDANAIYRDDIVAQ